MQWTNQENFIPNYSNLCVDDFELKAFCKHWMLQEASHDNSISAWRFYPARKQSLLFFLVDFINKLISVIKKTDAYNHTWRSFCQKLLFVFYTICVYLITPPIYSKTITLRIILQLVSLLRLIYDSSLVATQSSLSTVSFLPNQVSVHDIEPRQVWV